MRYWKSVVIGITVVACVLGCSVFVYFWSKDTCPIGTFTCSVGSKCVPHKYVCNNNPDCSDGDDEDPVLCSDINGSLNMLEKYENYNDTTQSRNMANHCDIVDYPRNCVCKYSTRIFCKNLSLTDVPSNISDSVTHLILANNSIHVLREDAFARYSLKVLYLEGNQLLELPIRIFSGQIYLQRLLLMYNNITEIKPGVFNGLSNLLWLFLDNNMIHTIDLNDLKDLTMLEWINLSSNRITLYRQKFPPLLRLLEAFLDDNSITEITQETFCELINLELLSLKRNQIAHIHIRAFEKLSNLRELDLFENHLSHLPGEVFDSLKLLNKIYLGKNPFKLIPSNLFHNLENLASLNMEGIEIENIDVDMFHHLTSLESVYFKKYSYCSYAPAVPRCRPLSDGVSSMQQMIGKPVLRYAAWVICFLTCIGNGLVLWGRYVFRDDNQTLSLVIRNLAVSDMLMGVYLMIIGWHDIKFRNVYNAEAHKWMSSWTCTITGMLAMVSSEVSVLLLAFMSVDRFLLIAIPFGRYSSVTAKEAHLLLTCIWFVGIGIAVIPVIEYLSSTRFYGVNGLCFPLYLDDPFLLGWKYSAVIFFGINASSLLVIGLVYCGMFVSIWKTRCATTVPVKDFDFAIRFFFIVLTDACCWFPIIMLKIYAIVGNEISVDLYGWLVVFVLPINSAINPLLYTFTTTKYRAKVYKASLPLCVQTKSKDISASSNIRRQSPHSTAEESGSVPVTNRTFKF